MQEAMIKFLELYQPGTNDLRIITSEGQITLFILGRQFSVMNLLPNCLQFYSNDNLSRIEFPLVKMIGCHTFPLTRYIGKGMAFNSPESEWEFEECIKVIDLN